ncbi:MAG TPA: sugar ABC transporter substrate-binding protein, partial [Chloroflexota bacterium]
SPASTGTGTATTAASTAVLSTPGGAAATSSATPSGVVTSGIATSAVKATTTSATKAGAATATSSTVANVVPKAGTVNFWAYVSNPAEAGQYDGYAKKYVAANPGKQVAVSGTGGDYYTKLQTMMAGGAPPDVVMLNNIVFPSYAAKGTLQDLSSLIARDKYPLDDFYPITYEAFTWQGAKLGLSTDLYVVGFYYVPQMFQAAGIKEPDATWTWTDVQDAAIKLTRPDKSQFGIRVYNDYARWCMPVWDYGADFFDKDENPTKAMFDQQGVIDAVSLWVNMIQKDHSSPTAAELKANPQLGGFWFGTYAMDLVDGPTILSLVQKNKANLAWAVAPYPKGPSGKNSTAAFPDGLQIPKGSKEVDNAWTFLKYLVSPEFLTTFAADTGRMPSRKSLAEGAGYQKPFQDAGVQHTDQLPAAATYSRVVASSGANLDIRSIANKEMAKSWDGSRAVKDSLQTINQQVQPLLDQLAK